LLLTIHWEDRLAVRTEQSRAAQLFPRFFPPQSNTSLTLLTACHGGSVCSHTDKEREREREIERGERKREGARKKARESVRVRKRQGELGERERERERERDS